MRRGVDMSWYAQGTVVPILGRSTGRLVRVCALFRRGWLAGDSFALAGCFWTGIYIPAHGLEGSHGEIV
jgi:hypothetical protein